MDEKRTDEVIVPVVEERATVARAVREGDSVRIDQTVTSREQQVTEALTRTHAEVERVALNREVNAVPAIRTEGDLLYIPVVEERLVVTKQLVLVEEIVVRRTVETEQVTVPVTLRRTEVTIERDPPR